MNKKIYVVSGNKITPHVSESNNKEEIPKDKKSQISTVKPRIGGKELFEQFLQKIEGCIKKKDREDVMTHLKNRFQNCQESYLHTKEFSSFMKSSLKQLSQDPEMKANVYDIIREITTTLKSYQKEKSGAIENHDQQANSPVQKNYYNTIDARPSTSRGEGDARPSTSREGDAQTKKRHHSGESHQEGSVKKKQKGSSRQIQRLEEFMFKMDKEIRRLSAKELTLDEMDRDDSSHIMEHKLKRKLVKLYQKACSLKGRSTECGRAIEKKIKFEGTRYPEINKKVEKLVNSGEFPDFQDIKNIIKKVNIKKGLNLTPKQVHSQAQNSFAIVGNKLIQRRKKDYSLNFGSYLTDVVDRTDDPAKHDKELEKKLRENRQRSKGRINDLLEQYTCQQYDFEAKLEKEDDEQIRKQLMGDDGDDDDDEEEEEEEEEGETVSIILDLDQDSNLEDEKDEADILYEPGLNLEKPNSIEGTSSNNGEIKMANKTTRPQLDLTQITQPQLVLTPFDSNSRPGSAPARNNISGAQAGASRFLPIRRNLDAIVSPLATPGLATVKYSPSPSGSRASPPFYNRLSRASRARVSKKMSEAVATVTKKQQAENKKESPQNKKTDSDSDDVICLSD